VDSFLLDAERILTAAGEASALGRAPRGLAILITREGGIHMKESCGWALAALEQHYGARAAYVVGETRTGVRVEGRSEGRKCLLERELPAKTARHLLACR